MKTRSPGFYTVLINNIISWISASYSRINRIKEEMPISTTAKKIAKNTTVATTVAVERSNSSFRPTYFFISRPTSPKSSLNASAGPPVYYFNYLFCFLVNCMLIACFTKLFISSRSIELVSFIVE